MSKLLALFPLEVVLFPGAPLPLHIFEPRYKEMIGDLLESKERFGVVRAREGGIEPVGCSAEVVAVAKRYEDGRMDIVTEGRDRFEIMQVNSEKNYLRAEVLYFVDEPDRPPAEDIERLLEMHKEMLQLLGANADLPDAADRQLTMEIAATMPFDLDTKQQLLASRSEPQRVAALIGSYEKVLPSLRRASKARRKAGGNGHV
ncbi:MAG: LON peptidase substrate-binding domain-containing protein [Terriglobales bacterium]